MKSITILFYIATVSVLSFSAYTTTELLKQQNKTLSKIHLQLEINEANEAVRRLEEATKELENEQKHKNREFIKS